MTTTADAMPDTGLVLGNPGRTRLGDISVQLGCVLVVELVAVVASQIPTAQRLGSPLYALLFLAAYAFSSAVTWSRRARLNLSLLDDLPMLVATLAFTAGIAYWAAALLDKSPTPHLSAVSVALALGGILVARLASYSIIRSLRSAFFGEPAVVIGTGRDAEFLVDRITTHPEYGLRLVGHVAARQMDVPNERKRRQATAERLFDSFPGVRTVLVADLDRADSELVGALRTAVARGCHVYFVPRFPELRMSRFNPESIWGLPLLAVSAPAGGLQRALKRSFDVVVSGLALVLLAPLLLVVGLVIRRETGGSILFRQKRIGLNGRPFNLLKFQTMVPRDPNEGDTQWNISEDDRIGKFGRFLRATSIDELPQLYNVLRGDMSLVGPRPERPHYVEMFSQTYSHYADRHRVPVGLTGWAQIHRLRGDTSIDDRARYDNAYCDQWSVWSDLKIILKTVPEVFRHSGG
jgi:exopolysaccharide biosynthesis polyprenyl glycosylphosphotransferase